MLKNLTLLLFIFCFVTMSCREEKLEGHWHMNHLYSNNYSTFDVKNDSTIIFQKYDRYSSDNCYHDSDKNKILMPWAEFSNELTYSINGEKIIFQNEDGEKFYGEKIPSISTEHIIQDFFSNLHLDIQLPTITNTSIELINFKIKNSAQLFIGPPKQSLIAHYSTFPLIQVADTFISLKEFDLWNQNFLVSKSEAIRTKINYTIFASQTTTLKKLQEVINELINIGVNDKNIFLVSKSLNPTNSNLPFHIFHYKYLNFDNLDRTLQESI